MLPIIIFFVSILILLQAIGKLASKKNTGKNDRQPEQVTGQEILQFTDSKKYAWTWMQAAGELELAYLRPTDHQPYPAFAGDSGDFRITVMGQPAEYGGDETVYRISFPKSAGLGLVLTSEKKRFPLGLSGICNPALFFQDHDMKSLYLAVQKQEIFRLHYLPACESFLRKNGKTFGDFRLTDSAFEFFRPGVENQSKKLVQYTQALLEAGHFFASLAEYTAVQPIPVSEEKEQKKITLKTPPEQIQLKPVKSEPVTETVKADVSLNKAALLSRLWHSSFPGNEERKFFEEQCKGKTVEWDGILRSCYDYSTDFVFGGNGGCKAVIELMELTQGNSAFKVKIKAVVSFPKETYQQLRNASGKKICFSGSLLKFEPLAKEIYVCRGNLLKLSE